MCVQHVSDLTYVKTAAGWLYVAVILELWSRRVAGWSTGITLASATGDCLAAVRGVRAQAQRGSQQARARWRIRCGHESGNHE
jgi:transposase InsO family protein